MAGYQNLQDVIQRIGSQLNASGTTAYFYGVPSEINDDHNRTYPVGSVYVNNTSVVVPNNYQRGNVEVSTNFEIYIWYGVSQADADVEPNVYLQNSHSQAQGIACVFLKKFYQAIEDDNFDMMITPNSSTNLVVFQEQGSDLIAGCRFNISVSYYEDCA
ncbi:MAG: hypothetical protein Unbinned5930contig1000_35 [Prokaryotic dsDNA virus sp.]|nr:MAG: hypothetical protein Unbinned5930contig1000_35 [Prokaryotic dsDNA virus sp.]|tara:strand:+ start:842 stop:1318 length:477 start_codon:yes stop_codon:yes gene_type:complete